jgi:hypothetical protein
MNTTNAIFTPLAPVASIEAPLLTNEARQVLLDAINGTRMGFFTFSVALEYDKQTKAKPRVEGEHYMGLPGVSCKLHVGTLVAAPTNKEGQVYLRVLDMARADGENAANWTAFKLSGIKSFQVRGAIPGPATKSPASA